MIYADEGFYTEKYLLGKKPAIRAGFAYYAREASQIIDQHTFGRLEGKTKRYIPEHVQMCCCELAEQCFSVEKQMKEAGKTAEKVGSYSISYESGSDIKKRDSIDKRNIIMKWLSDTDLCYGGL